MADQANKDHVEELSGKLDTHMNKYAGTGTIDKLMKQGFMKQLTDNSLINAIDGWLQPYFDGVMTVLGVLAMIGGVLGLFGVLGMFSALFAPLMGGGFIIIILVSLVGSLLSLIQGWGLFKKKKRAPFAILIGFGWSVISLLVHEMFWSGYYRGTGNYRVMMIISLLIFLLILKNRAHFKH